MKQPTARVIEIFPSIQGEGIYVGRPHLFVRFWDCNLACHYCDTDYRGPYQEYAAEELSDQVERHLQSAGPFHAVSLTGGEPLLWWKFLREWLPRLKALGQRTYLETNGTLPSSLEQVMPWIDIVAMDIKPPSATADRAVWEEHENFLRIAHGAHREIFIKTVVTRETLDQELQRAIDLVCSVDTRIPFILQPVSPWGAVREGPLSDQLTRWQGLACRRLADVRIIPQVHRILGVP